MDIILPAIPAGVLTLLSFFSPYAIALINHPSWKAGSKRLVAVAVSIALTLLVLVFYYAMTGDLVPSWPIMVLLALAIGQAAYTLLKSSATRVEARYGVK